MADEVATLKVLITGDASDLQSAIQKTEAELNKLDGKSISSGKGLEKGAKSAGKAYKELGAGVKQFGDDLDTITKPLQVGAAAMAAGGVAAVKFAMDYETAFTGVKKTVNGTDAELNKLNGDIRQMALEVPVSAKELANLAAIGGQLGVGVNDISKFTETIAAMGVATNLAGEEGASALARFINVTGESLDNVDRIGSTIVALGNNSATTEREIADMAVRMGKFGNTVGINAQQVLGYSAALSSMGVEAQAGGSAIGRIWLGIEEAVSSGGAALSAYAKYSGKTAEEFRNLWSTDASGAFKGLIEGLHATEDLTKAMSELGVNNTLDIQSLMALANGYETLEKSLSLASTAYAENTALTKEAEAAYATTASQIQLAKNNLVEAAMGFGELLLPTVTSATGGIKEFAQGLAGMDEAQKQGLITTGKWVIGLGATAKVTTGAIKGIGSTMQAMGSIKEAISAGGVLSKFGPALTKIGAAAGPAALGIIAVGTAVTVGKKAYDAWYDSQYRFAEGLSEGNAAIRESVDEVKRLSDIQSQIKDLNLVIENPEASKEDIDNAKLKLEEIKALLAEEYNLVINTNDNDVDDKIESLKSRSRNELQRDLNDQQEKLNNVLPKMGEYNQKLNEMQTRYNQAESKLTYYDTLNTKIHTLQSNLQAGTITQEEYTQGWNKIAKELNVSPQSLGIELFKGMEGAKKTMEELAPKISDTTSSIDEAKQASKEYLAILEEIEQLDGEGSKIKITADSEEAESVLNGTEQTIKEIDGESVEFQISADGKEATAIIDGVSYKVAAFDEKTGEAILTADGQTASMVINTTTGEVTTFNSLEGRATLTAIDNATATAEAAANSISGIKSKTVTITAIFKKIGDIFNFAKGTSDAPGGLAMINDERGTSDPRELVEVGGKGYIFEGKDVVLPLPKHAKVYTADQTKAIMAGKGIPHYARGHQNDAWDAAQDDWRYYTTVNNVSASEALKHWDAMLEKFKNDAEVVKEIQEEIVASTKALWNEELDAMQFSLDMGWISQEEYYEKLWKYRDEHFEVGTEEWKDATLKLHEWDEQQRQNDLDNLKDYLDMGWITQEEYYERLWQYRDANFEAGSEEWVNLTKELQNYNKELLRNANAESEAWVRNTNYLDSWEAQGDSMLEAYVRFRDRNLQAVQEGVPTEQEAYSDNFSFMETMLEDRLDTAMSAMDREARVWGLSSDAQLAEINKLRDEYSAFFDSLGTLTDDQLVLKMKIDAQLEDETFDVIGKKISKWEQSAALYMRESQTLGWDWKNKGDSEAAYYLRMQRTYQELLDDGGLNAEMREEYRTKRREAELDAYAAASTQFDEMLSQKMDEINEMRTTLSDKVSNLREKWSTEDRQEDIRDVKEQLSIYENAVTKEGREEYERLQEQLKQLERDEQIFQMEKDNNRIIAQMERAYAKLEDDKSKQIEDILSNASAFNSTMESNVPDILKEASDVSLAMNESLKPDVDAVKNALTNSENGLPGICDAIVSFRKGLVEAVEKIDFNVDINNTFEVDEDNIFGKLVNSFVRGVASKWGGR